MNQERDNLPTDTYLIIVGGINAPGLPTLGGRCLVKRALMTDPADRPTNLAECFQMVNQHRDLPQGFRVRMLNLPLELKKELDDSTKVYARSHTDASSAHSCNLMTNRETGNP